MYIILMGMHEVDLLEKYLEHIAATYNGELGPNMEIARRRLHWIIKNIYGNNVLDVGCGEGILSILLSREGKTVKGIDMDQQSIELAKKTLMDEQDGVHPLVEFLQGNFFLEKLPTNHFDSIIVADILEDYISSTEIFKKVNSLLIEKGRIIVTVPFGLSNSLNKKRTLYLTEIYNEMSIYFNIEKVEMIGNWIGFIGIKDINKSETFPSGLFTEIENAFYSIEQELTKKNDETLLELISYQKRVEILEGKVKHLLSLESDYLERGKIQNDKIVILEKKLDEQININHHLKETNQDLGSLYKEKEARQLEMIDFLQRKVDLDVSIIKGLKTDNWRYQDKIKNIINKLNEERKNKEEFNKKLQDINTNLKNQKEINLSLKESNHSLKNQFMEYEQKLIEVTQKNEGYEHQNNQLKAMNRELSDEIKRKIQLIDTLENQSYSLQRNIKKLDQEILETQLNLKDNISKHLIDLEETTKQLMKVMKEKDAIQRKYKSLKNSKLGKMVVKYWALRSKILNRGK